MQTKSLDFYKKITSTEKALGKKLPFSLQAERAVLGSLLLNDEYVAIVSEILLTNDFYLPEHRLIYNSIVSLSESSKKIDVITLQDYLEKSNILNEVGGLAYLIGLQEEISAIGSVEQHANIIKEKAILRDLISSATSIITNCYAQDDQEISAVLDHAEKTIFNISNKRSAQGFVQLDIWLKKTFQQLSEIKTHRQGITGIPSGYSKLDGMTSGFQPGDLIVLAARPSMGKTALALSLAHHAAAIGYSVGFFSLEMGAEQLTLRLLSGASRIKHHHIRNATINSDEWVDLTNAAAQLAEYKFYIDDAPGQTIMDIRAKARKIKAEHNLQFLVVDYLQLLHSVKKHENRHQEVSEISRSLKALAKELGLPILALSQLSRAVDSRVDKRPMLSDLRESGAIEQDADLIIFLYRDVVYNSETEDPHLAELIIGKQRNGPTGTVHLHFQHDLTIFEDID